MRAKKRRTRIALPLAVLISALVPGLTQKASAHHESTVPAMESTSSLMGAYELLYERSQRSERVDAGRNVLEDGRSKDGRVVWEIVKAEAVRLWRALHPGNETEHQKREVMSAFAVPAWFEAAADRVASCESGQRWDINTGNGFSGGLQFMDSTWQGMGGSSSAYLASRAEQIYRAYLLWQHNGWGPWPVCGRLAG